MISQNNNGDHNNKGGFKHLPRGLNDVTAWLEVMAEGFCVADFIHISVSFK